MLRPIHTNPLAEAFVKNILGIKSRTEVSKAVNRVVKAEMLVAQIGKENSLTSSDYRDTMYKDDESRADLRGKILDELIDLQRLQNDDDIKLGLGGARPELIKKEKQAFIITGLPASGKSGVARKVADLHGAFILDSDFAKRKFPEYLTEFGAHLVHEESSLVVFGSPVAADEFTLQGYCLSEDYNVVIPKIGHSVLPLTEQAEYLKDHGYSVHLILVSLDRGKATNRAYQRFVETNRYVPLSLIFDSYSNDPILTYYRIRYSDYNKLFTSIGKVTTDVPRGTLPKIVESIGNSPVNKLFKK